MLDKKFRIDGLEAPGNFEIDFKRDSDWTRSSKRVLIILQTVDGADLHAEELGSTPALVNAIKYAKKIARTYNDDLPQASFAVTNFNAKRHLHMKGQARSAAESEFRTRQLKLIKRLDPTHILFSGDVSVLYPITNPHMKNGWVHKIDNRYMVSTLDFGRLMEKQGALANLLGFFCRHLANLLLERNPHDLRKVDAKPIVVDTVAKFDKMLSYWDKARRVAVDTETRNLTVTSNKIYTSQFAFDADGVDPAKGYVVIIDHPHEDNKISAEDRKYFKRELRKRMGRLKGPELITFNGIFDLRIYRQCLNLNIIHHPVWEIMAGEHLLDENISSMVDLGIKSGGLAAVYASYGNDFYFDENTSFTKADRSTTGAISPYDEGFLKYGATDVVSILHIADQQVERAKHQNIGSKTYEKAFVRHMRYQMSDTVHQLSHLKQEGSLINRKYLRSLLKPDSPLAKAVADLIEEFKTFPEVIKANEELLGDTGFKAKSLFGGGSKGSSQWVFSMNKALHKTKLFLEVCGLKSISQTATGADAIDKEFIAHYKDRNYLVAKFGEYQEAAKLYSTYIKGWYKQLTREVDGATDSCLRPDYVFFDVDTGRLASKAPNLQNIPSRGKLAKIIKEMFITPDGYLLIRFDYSAHEVRAWSIASGDTVLAAAFKAGQKLRQKLIKSPSDEIRKELKTKGDIHIQNVFRFFKIWIEKSNPLRDAIKAVVFGVLYGKSAETLGGDIKRNDLEQAKAEVSTAYKADDKKALAKAVAKFEALLEEDRSDKAQDIIDKMFAEFKRGHQWVLRMQKLATEEFYVFSPIGRLRHLYAAMVGIRSTVNRQVRRGMNAPLQGFASEIAVKASRKIMKSYYEEVPTFEKYLGEKITKPLRFNRIVHDALYYAVPYEVVLPFLHILQYDATYGVAADYKEQFGLEFTVEPEIEIEIGTKDTNAEKWSWELPELIKILESSVDEGIKLGFLSDSKEDIMKQIYAPWRNKKFRKYLDDKYPLLNVSLFEEIGDALNN